MLAAALFPGVAAAASGESFDEALLARPLPDGAVLLFANFSVSSGRDLRDLELFPRALAELALATKAREVHLSLGAGRWLADEWGHAPAPAPAGAAVSARIPAAASGIGWHRLTAGLDALLCSGIGRLGAPRHKPQPHCEEGVCNFEASDVREGVCTENLAGWLSLSPCNRAAGVGALLDDAALGTGRNGIWGAARHTAIRLHLREECAESQNGGCRRTALRAQMSFTLVLPPTPGRGSYSNEWLDSLVSSAGLHACPLARRSTFSLELAEGATEVEPLSLLSPTEVEMDHASFSSLPWRRLRWDLPHAPATPLNLSSLRWRLPASSDEEVGFRPSMAMLTAYRSVRGVGDRGGVLLLEVSSRLNVAVRAECADILPAWMRVHWHSLRAQLREGDGVRRPIPQFESAFRPAIAPQPPSQVLSRLGLGSSEGISHGGGAEAFGVGVEVGSGQRLEWALTLPPHSSAIVELEFGKPLQHVDALLADPSGGLPIGGARVTFTELDGPRRLQIFTEPVTVPVPIVDASMPFNVIAISSTVIALFVGSMFSLFVRETK